MEALILLAKDFFETDWGLVQFSNKSNAMWLGVIFLAMVVVKILMGRKRKKTREVSGHFIYKTLQQGILSRLIHLIPKVIISAGVFFLLFAYADPFTSRSQEREMVDSRERVELLDVSGSMGYDSENRQRESVAEIVRRQHLRFLDMRRGMNDRVSLWLFSNNPFKMEGFIQDDDVYKMQVMNAPLVIAGKRHPLLSEEEFVAPMEKVHLVPYQGGTDLKEALKAVLRYLSQESDVRIERKTIFLITDAAMRIFPEPELREIRRRGIILYALFVKPAPVMYEHAKTNRGIAQDLENSRQFIRRLESFGGTYFEAEDEESLSRIFDEINRLESIRIQKVRHAIRNHIYHQPLAIAMILLLVGVLLALSLEVLLPDRP